MTEPNYMDNFLRWLESTTPEERLGRVEGSLRRAEWRHDERCCMNGVAPTAGPHPGCDGVTP